MQRRGPKISGRRSQVIADNVEHGTSRFHPFGRLDAFDFSLRYLILLKYSQQLQSYP